MRGQPRTRRAVLLIAGVTTFLASVGVNLQIRANSQLATEGVSPTRIAVINMGLQFLCVIIVVFASRRLRAAIRRLIKATRTRQVRPWWFVGGLVGALVVTSMGVVGPLVGVAVFSIALVAGQTTSSLAVDRWGLGPGGKRQLTGARVGAAFIAICAVVVSVSDRIAANAVDDLAWGAAVFALVAGLLISFQAAANGQLARVSGQPAIGAGVNFGVGAIALAVIGPFLPLHGDRVPLEGLGDTWLYLGAIFGLLVVLNTAWAVRYLGILLLTVIGVSGQMLGALVMDLVFPTEGAPVTPALIAGLLMAIVAVAVGSSTQWLRGTRGSASAP